MGLEKRTISLGVRVPSVLGISQSFMWGCWAEQLCGTCGRRWMGKVVRCGWRGCGRGVSALRWNGVELKASNKL